jgi:tetratricopeptide (TPR) repeat protein/predicted Ser/Thr protein kinase
MAAMEESRRIGPFTILSPIGEGGMGEVYLAEQDNPRRQVALKVIRPGALSEIMLRRFELEAAVLARLQHPGIAQIFQAGTAPTSEGDRPYFAMEYVRGLPLDRYAATQKLSTRQRLDLVARICDAVEHAHMKGVVHRDLKPANILVTEDGQPKILDFGVARATDADLRTTSLRTEIGAFVGTVPYMSPEQVSGDPEELDTRSDVYALGVVIYELLAGRLPFAFERKMLHEAVRMIREDEPMRLSSVDRHLRGDVETIVAKALEKERGRRYQSARELASDIRRYLDDEPIAARPASAGYQLRKFARRNKALVAGTGGVILALAAGVVVSTVLLFRARSAEVLASERAEAAKLEARKAERVAGFSQRMLEGIEPSFALGADTTLLERMLGEAAARIPAELGQEPELAAAMEYTVGSAYLAISGHEAAEAHLRTRSRLGNALVRRENYPEAEPLLRETAASQARVLGPDDRDTLATQGQLAGLLWRSGRSSAGLELQQATLARQEDRFGAEDADVLNSRLDLASALWMNGRMAEAEVILRELWTTDERLLGPDHPRTLNAMASLATVLSNQERNEEARGLFVRVIELARRVYGPEHQATLTILNNYGSVLRELGDWAGAEALYRQTLADRRRVLGVSHGETLTTQRNLAACLTELGRPEEAELLLRDALALAQGTSQTNRLNVSSAYSSLGRHLGAQRRFREASGVFREAARITREIAGESSSDYWLLLYNSAATLQDDGDDAAAETIFRQVIDLHAAHAGGDEPFLAATLNGLAKCLWARQDYDGAEPLFRAGLALRRRLFPADHREISLSLHDYARMLYDAGRRADAEPLLVEGEGILRTLDEPDRLGRTQALLARLRFDDGRFEEAEACLLSAWEVLEAGLPGSRSDLREALVLGVDLYRRWEEEEGGKSDEIAEVNQRLEALGKDG